MTRKAAFVYQDGMSRHVLSETHPMRPVRLRYTYELAEAYGLFQPDRSSLAAPRAATVDEVSTFHTAEYISAVERVGEGDFSVNPMEFNIGPGRQPRLRGNVRSGHAVDGRFHALRRAAVGRGVRCRIQHFGRTSPRDAGLCLRVLRLQRSRAGDQRDAPTRTARGLRRHRLSPRRRRAVRLLRYGPCPHDLAS